MGLVLRSLEASLWIDALLCIASLLVRLAVKTPRARYFVGITSLALMAVAPLVFAAIWRGPDIVFIEQDRSSFWLTMWVIGSLLAAARLSFGWARIQSILSRAQLVSAPHIINACDRLCRQLSLARAPRLLITEDLISPCVIGVFRTTLLLPASILARLTPEQLETVIAHELAHVCRRDFLANLLQTTVETALFFHPGVWLISHYTRSDRELCCDDVVLKLTGQPLTYARALTEVASAWTPSVVPSASSGMLQFRVRRLLGVSSGPSPKRLGFLLTAILVCSGFIAREKPTTENPRLIFVKAGIPKSWQVKASFNAWTDHVDFRIDLGKDKAEIHLDKPGEYREHPWFFLGDGTTNVLFEGSQKPGGPIVFSYAGDHRTGAPSAAELGIPARFQEDLKKRGLAH